MREFFVKGSFNAIAAQQPKRGIVVMSYWKSIDEEPLPTSGEVIVSVNRRWGVVASFTAVVRCDEAGPIGRDGDAYLYAKEITHWMELPKPASIVISHEAPA